MNLSRKTPLIAACLACVAWMPSAGASGKPLTYTKVDLVAAGEVDVSPDRALIRGAVTIDVPADQSPAKSTASTPDLKAGLAQINQRISAVMDAARKAGLSDDDIVAASLQVNPQYRYDRNGGQQTLTSYRMSRDVTLTLNDDLSRIGPLLTALADTGFTNIQPTQLDVSRSLRDKAVKEATEDGMKNLYAQARQLGQLQGFETMNVNAQTPRPGPMPYLAKAMVMDSGAAPTETAVGLTTVQVSISATARIVIRER